MLKAERYAKAGAWLPLFLMGLNHPASADDDYDAEARDLEYVQVTATRRAAREFDVAAAVSQVDSVSVQAEIPDVLAEMLRGLPGTFFQQTTPGQGVPVIRGLKGSQVLHLVDGMRLNNAFFRDAPNQYIGLVDAFAMERVEVVRGAAGTLYGADAMGGVVNILTREPLFDGPDWQSNGSFYGAFNSADDSWVGRASLAGGREGVSFSGGVTWQDHQDRRTGGGITVSPSGYRSEAADIKLLVDVGERDDLTFNAQVLEQPSTPRVDELVPGYGQETPSSEIYSFEPNRREFMHMRWRRDSASAWYDRFELNLARQTVTDDRVTQNFGSPELTREGNESVLDGVTAQFDATLPADHLLSWGIEYYTDAVSSSRSRLDTSTGQSRQVRSRFPNGSSMDSMAAFARMEWLLHERLTLGTGLRYSSFDIRLPAGNELEAVRLTPSDVTGDLNLLYALSDQWHLVANIGRGFRPPNIFDLATLGPRPGNRFNVPNPALGPESVWSYDTGVKLRNDQWEFEVFAFYLDYRDKITSVATGEVTPEGRVVVTSENRNTLVLYGLETGVRWAPLDALEMYGVLNYTHGEERDDSGLTTPGDRIPPLNGKVGLRLEPWPRWSVEGYWLFAGRQDRLSPRDVRDPRIDPAGTAGWGTLNVLLRWDASEWLDLGLKLENVGDARYREHGSGIDAPGLNLGIWLDAAW